MEREPSYAQIRFKVLRFVELRASRTRMFVLEELFFDKCCFCDLRESHVDVIVGVVLLF